MKLSGEEGTLLRDPHSAGKNVWARFDLAQHLEAAEGLLEPTSGTKPQLSKPLLRPPRAAFLWRLGDDQATSSYQQRRRAFSRHRWRPEAPGHHKVGPSPPISIPARLFCSRSGHHDVGGDAQLHRGAGEKQGPALAAVEKSYGHRWPGLRQHEARKTGSAPQVHNPGRELRADCLNETLGMLDMAFYRPRA